jgi:hypothetical protein
LTHDFLAVVEFGAIPPTCLRWQWNANPQSAARLYSRNRALDSGQCRVPPSPPAIRGMMKPRQR